MMLLMRTATQNKVSLLESKNFIQAVNWNRPKFSKGIDGSLINTIRSFPCQIDMGNNIQERSNTSGRSNLPPT